MKARAQVSVPTRRIKPRRRYRAGGPKLESGCRRDRQNHLDIIGLVRSVQRSEGHSDCFRRNVCDCDQLDCPWRGQCFQKG